MRATIALSAAIALAASANAQVTTNYKYDTIGQLSRVEVVGGDKTCYYYDAAYNRTVVRICPSAPSANNDLIYDYTYTSVGTSFLNVLANDTDPDLPGDTLQVTSITPAWSASYFSIASGGTGINFNGLPGFYIVTYEITDSTNLTSQAEVSFELIYCDFGGC